MQTLTDSLGVLVDSKAAILPNLLSNQFNVTIVEESASLAAAPSEDIDAVALVDLSSSTSSSARKAAAITIQTGRGSVDCVLCIIHTKTYCKHNFKN